MGLPRGSWAAHSRYTRGQARAGRAPARRPAARTFLGAGGAHTQRRARLAGLCFTSPLHSVALVRKVLAAPVTQDFGALAGLRLLGVSLRGPRCSSAQSDGRAWPWRQLPVSTGPSPGGLGGHAGSHCTPHGIASATLGAHARQKVPVTQELPELPACPAPPNRGQRQAWRVHREAGVLHTCRHRTPRPALSPQPWVTATKPQRPMSSHRRGSR